MPIMDMFKQGLANKMTESSNRWIKGMGELAGGEDKRKKCPKCGAVLGADGKCPKCGYQAKGED